jgi:acetolactate synthase I/II/III large subunit
LQIARSSPPGPVYLMGAREVMESEVQPLDLEKIQPQKWKPLGPMALAGEVLSPKMYLRIGRTNSCGNSGGRKVPLDHDILCGKGSTKSTPSSQACRVPGMRCSRKYWSVHDESLGPLGGKDLEGHIKKADVILVFESDVPWVPHHNKPSPETVVYHIDCDPLKEQMPMQWFRADGYFALRQLTEKVSIIGEVQNKDERIKVLWSSIIIENYKIAEKPADVIKVPYLTARFTSSGRIKFGSSNCSGSSKSSNGE